MITTSFCFSHFVSRQVELRLPRTLAGSPVTATVAFVSPPKLAELRSARSHTGSPVTETLAFVPPPTLAELRTAHCRAGSPITSAIAFVPPSIRTELRSVHANAGSSIAAVLAFAPPLVPTVWRWRNTYVGSPVTSTLAFPKRPTQTTSLRLKSEWKTWQTATIHLRNDYHHLTTTSIGYCYDWKAIVGTALQYKHWSVVKPGWRIVAKNIVTNESLVLGFIDVDNPALGDVFLPDGDYEISVLTSSLFWKDCLDRTVRTISVRPGEEVTPLPTIYNLRSAVLNGVTTIRWSANQSELVNCVFGAWYGSDSPVDTNRPPDATIWYYASQTEYATIFYQNAPAYVAVAAMQNGDEPGKIQELYLDWSNVPPHRPDDVLVLSAPLPVVDKTVEERREDDTFWSMWGG